MLNPEKIADCLFGVVTWSGSDDPCRPALSSDLSGASFLKVDNYSALVSIDNLVDLAPNFSGFNYPFWDAVTAYSVGDKVIVDNIAYIATAASTGAAPATSPSEW